MYFQGDFLQRPHASAMHRLLTFIIKKKVVQHLAQASECSELINQVIEQKLKSF